jgi:hypothetical protein
MTGWVHLNAEKQIFAAVKRILLGEILPFLPYYLETLFQGEALV